MAPNPYQEAVAVAVVLTNQPAEIVPLVSMRKKRFAAVFREALTPWRRLGAKPGGMPPTVTTVFGAIVALWMEPRIDTTPPLFLICTVSALVQPAPSIVQLTHPVSPDTSANPAPTRT